MGTRTTHKDGSYTDRKSSGHITSTTRESNGSLRSYTTDSNPIIGPKSSKTYNSKGDLINSQRKY